MLLGCLLLWCVYSWTTIMLRSWSRELEERVGERKPVHLSRVRKSGHQSLYWRLARNTCSLVWKKVSVLSSRKTNAIILPVGHTHACRLVRLWSGFLKMKSILSIWWGAQLLRMCWKLPLEWGFHFQLPDASQISLHVLFQCFPTYFDFRYHLYGACLYH